MIKGLACSFAYFTYTLSQLEAVLSIAFELLNVRARLGLTFLERLEQFFKFTDGFLRLALRLGFTCLGRVLQFQATVVQFFLRLATLLFQLRQQFFRISQRLRAGLFQVFEQAARKLLEQV
ncbi:hypothetical protein RPPX_08355 [Pseudomonas putida S12]|uniref:Uncharacterized protein n=1 Tax=Pseudomonas putida S12 TaxID=1215087 RepID=A0AA34RTU4_PSEPU|nr:hypothetical protein RPPX_08355 [Pseudomonas putida S12]KMU93964.1 hypothetical protein AC138_20825 [Pseudomonas putida]KMY37723.1 hypothetical protein AA993_01095 [Pseudomonas putida]